MDKKLEQFITLVPRKIRLTSIGKVVFVNFKENVEIREAIYGIKGKLKIKMEDKFYFVEGLTNKNELYLSDIK